MTEVLLFLVGVPACLLLLSFVVPSIIDNLRNKKSEE